MRKAIKREDFKVCPICKGKFVHSDEQSECLHCFFVLMDECCYTITGEKIVNMKLDDWYKENCKLGLEKSACPKLTKSDFFDCGYCANHLPNISPRVFGFQCSKCGYRRVSRDAKIQDTNCERCSNGIMLSKDLDNTTFQDPKRKMEGIL